MVIWTAVTTKTKHYVKSVDKNVADIVNYDFNDEKQATLTMVIIIEYNNVTYPIQLTEIMPIKIKGAYKTRNDHYNTLNHDNLDKMTSTTVL